MSVYASHLQIVIHPSVPRMDSQKTLDLVDFARKFVAEYSAKGFSVISRLEPWSNNGKNFSIVLGIEVPSKINESEYIKLSDDLVQYSEDHYPHHTKARLVVGN